ncbi:hypothetical protein HanXRQr2_Chr04g0170691 [Helianthus annuus]|uniref:Uncharacterized protein n=1 Tax=Helianthus annuus TaxID=4232 RepID=A0A251V0Q8_HELAN|nr:uncharacterized protein LOC110936904 [Helianthus annuus]KAF5810536.1 hypothetical protein HanXRQr2_Chr04g0170691 [Helianthus annuus]KAJ0589273.1 hypothetical protein HanIR_Chr04g0184271 [Helianthus annuus]KAJ0931646.1 hypothetical protein HanPSC8_Chr04g0164251 [Helianthus annuus]
MLPSFTYKSTKSEYNTYKSEYNTYKSLTFPPPTSQSISVREREKKRRRSENRQGEKETPATIPVTDAGVVLVESPDFKWHDFTNHFSLQLVHQATDFSPRVRTNPQIVSNFQRFRFSSTTIESEMGVWRSR